MKHNLTKATEISKAVKHAVGERDNWKCIICGRYGEPNSHYIKRSQQGMGIEENIVTMCLYCHTKFDSDVDFRGMWLPVVKEYLDRWYPEFTDADRKYDKWKDYEY